MKNKICDGRTIEYFNNTGSIISGGSLVLVEDLAGVAVADIADQETGVLDLEGVFEVPAAAVAFNKGEKAYLITASGLVTNVSTDNVPIGTAFAGSASGDGVAQIKINVTNA